jgi:uncharacterized membrane protein/uncharacterized RDD family membrane protein YckC
MVDGSTLALDVLETSVYFAAPVLLWLFVYLFATTDAAMATSAGFDRPTFWLLIPGALLGEFANLLFFGYRADLLAINVGGGAIPLLLSVWLLYCVLPNGTDGLVAVLLGAVAGTGGALAVVEIGIPGSLGTLLIVAAVALPTVALVVATLRAQGPRRTTLAASSAVVGLIGATVVITQLTTSTIPGLGIVSAFPAYLLAPLILGALTAVALRRSIGGSFGPSMAVAYSGVTLGVLVGADVLHQPPLYGNGPGALYSIGGAGLLDLLHLSGLLALLGAFLVVTLLRRSAPVPRTLAPVPASPQRLIRRAWYLGMEGRFAEAIRESRRATLLAVDRLREVEGIGPRGPTDPWRDLPVPEWLGIDQANLEAISERPELAGRDAYRSWLTARGLVAFAQHRAAQHRPDSKERARAFGIDLALLLFVALALDLAIILPLGGNSDSVLNGLALNAAVVAVVGWGLAYFVLFEGVIGATPGKRFLGLVVRMRSGAPLEFRALWIRNLPRIIPLSILSYGTALLIAVATHPAGPTLVAQGFSGPAFYLAGVGVAMALGLGLTAIVSMLTIGSTEEGQRLGDLLSGSSVVLERPRGEAVPTAPAGVPVAGSSPPVGA